MQKKRFSLLLAFGLLLCGWALQAQNTNNCNLPAPTNIQFSQSNSTTLHVTWNPVTGAVGFLATLENLSNPTQAAQAVTTVSTSAQFTVIPGNMYRCRVRAIGLTPQGSFCVSPNYGQVYCYAVYAVIDLIVSRDNCTPSGNSITLNSGDSYGDLTPGNKYAAVLNGAGQSPSPKYSFQYTDSKFVFQGLGSVPSGEILEGLEVSSFPNPVYKAPTANNPIIVSSDIKLDYPNLIGDAHISFGSPSSIFFRGPNGTSLTIYFSCDRPGDTPPGTNEGDDPITPTIDPVAQATLRNIQVVNPFDSDLTLLFFEHPEQAVTAQLLDVSGRIQLQQTIEPGSIAGNQYKLATTNLQPGMYFLRLETAPGVFSTHKVVKYDQR